MIIVDEEEPVGDVQPKFDPRSVTIKKGADAKEFYDLLTEVGRGKFGTVYKCREKSTGLTFAAKFIPIPKRDDRRNVEREVEIMNSLQHSLLIQLYDAYEYGKMMCVVLELVEGGELFDRVIDDEFVLTEKSCIVLVRQICQAMQFVHSHNIIHLDLKPENILCLSREGNRIKIIDFGLARRYDPDKKLQVLFGTPEFVAPEVVNFDRISFGTDMWSVGVICYVLLSGLSPFMGSTDIETMTNVTIGKYDFDDEAFSKVSKNALNFISKLLVKDLSERMTGDQALEHAWLQQTTPKSNLKPSDTKITEKSPPNNTEDVSKNGCQELTSTKENLKQFIERWEEHPNSPYIFDSSTTLILPVHDNEKNISSGFSSRGCSPSPCESLSSNVDLESSEATNEIDDFASENGTALSDTFDISNSTNIAKQNIGYLQSFDRRHSDSNYITRNRTSSLDKVDLAEEIKKLSDRLMILSSLNDELQELKRNSDESNDGEPSSNASTETSASMKSSSSSNSFSSSSAEHSEKLATQNRRNEKMATSTTTTTRTTTIHSKSLREEGTSSHHTNSVVNDLTERLRSLDEMPSVFKRLINVKNFADKCDEGTSTTAIRESFNFAASLNSNKSSNNGNDSSHSVTIHQSTPWPITTRRTKFRITQLSRDVPIGSPDSHQTIFLEEAANTTKDCLLHLLDKYNTKQSRANSSIRRHQSISGHGITDNLEYHSMNSINAFFKRNAFQHNGRTVRKLKARIESRDEQ